MTKQIGSYWRVDHVEHHFSAVLRHIYNRIGFLRCVRTFCVAFICLHVFNDSLAVSASYKVKCCRKRLLKGRCLPPARLYTYVYYKTNQIWYFLSAKCVRRHFCRLYRRAYHWANSGIIFLVQICLTLLYYCFWAHLKASSATKASNKCSDSRSSNAQFKVYWLPAHPLICAPSYSRIAIYKCVNLCRYTPLSACL